MTRSVTRHKTYRCFIECCMLDKTKEKTNCQPDRQKKTNKPYPAACRLLGRGRRSPRPLVVSPVPAADLYFQGRPVHRLSDPCLLRPVDHSTAGLCFPRWLQSQSPRHLSSDPHPVRVPDTHRPSSCPLSFISWPSVLSVTALAC